MSETILVIDDDPIFNGVLARALIRRGYLVEGATNEVSALLIARSCCPDWVVLDLNLAGVSGLSLIESLLQINSNCRIVVLTGYASIATAVDAIKLGAIQYLAKPVEVDAILAAFTTGDMAVPSEVIPSAIPLSVDRLEWEHIQRVLREYQGNISATARALKMHRRTLQRKLAKRPVRE